MKFECKELKNLHSDSINCIQINSVDGNCLIFSCSDEELNVIHENGSNKQTILGGADELTSLKLTTLGDRIFLSNSKYIQIFDTNSQKQLNRYKFFKDTINCFEFSTDESLLASCDDSGEIKLFDLRTKEKECLKLKQSYRKHENICSYVKFNPLNCQYLMSGSFDCNLIKWDLRYSNLSQSCLYQININEVLATKLNQQNEFMSTMTPAFIHTIEFFKNYILTGIENGMCLIFDFNDLKYLTHDQLHNYNCALVKISQLSDDLFVSGGNDGKFQFFAINIEGKITRKDDLTIDNSLKINSFEINEQNLYVCDTSNDLKIYMNKK